ncbi:hypothetical protein MTR67_028486 [Solanum verrucosum]|uniref:Reverse transcriptase/retrotransposon-derived protein RNase H-like domain-containing protein n=1 Tax=Solanum verrucosum TaxID=315347 RepID=A0AAF0R470_SOLVR|nr:hypothetical protein MTR67_028486 [Solanum verrucosum]
MPEPLPDSSITDEMLAEELQNLEVMHSSSLSYHAMAGGDTISALRFTGYIQGSSVNVMLDNGSTHNFIQTHVANFLHLTIETIPPFSVMVGSGQRLPCNGIVRQVPLMIQGSLLTMDFFVLPIHGSDIALGVSWLATLGRIVTDYVQLQCLRRLCATDAIVTYYHLQLVGATPSKSPETTPPAISALLDSFGDVFTKPQGLPPTRLQDHAIHLAPATRPVNVNPYRYPYFQKQVMEQLVNEMLSEGIIHPRTSPFSSPVLLWPAPRNIKKVRSFLGLASYYRRFIRNYAMLASPLTDLLCTDSYSWTPNAQAAFENLQSCLSSTPVLALPDFSQLFQVETDASGKGIGAVLSQKGHPVAYFSQKLCPRMQQASTYVREC